MFQSGFHPLLVKLFPKEKKKERKKKSTNEETKRVPWYSHALVKSSSFCRKDKGEVKLYFMSEGVS